jgi:hypothetical protein
MFASKPKAIKLVDREDVDGLRKYLAKHPSLLDEKYDWGNYAGTLLHYAAYMNKPAVVELLVTEKKMDADSHVNVSNKWTPLHHAETARAYRAAARLLALGASTDIPNAGGATTADFAGSAAVQKILDPLYEDKARQKAEAARAQEQQRATETAAQEKASLSARAVGTWTLTGSAEVTHEYDLPDGSHRLKDIFNFQTRIWRSLVTDLKTSALAQNIVFFDGVPDPALLHAAFQKLKALGGEADESAVSPASLPKKILKPAT